MASRFVAMLTSSQVIGKNMNEEAEHIIDRPKFLIMRLDKKNIKLYTLFWNKGHVMCEDKEKNTLNIHI